MGLTVVDASIAIAVVDAGDALYDVAATVVEETDSLLVLPASAYAETMVRPHRLGQAASVRARLDLLGFGIEPLSDAMADEAARLRARYPTLRIADALVIATGRMLDADRVLTRDERWAVVWDRIRILRPGP